MSASVVPERLQFPQLHDIFDLHVEGARSYPKRGAFSQRRCGAEYFYPYVSWPSSPDAHRLAQGDPARQGPTHL